MKIMKFGGAVLKEKNGFQKMAEIIKANNDEPLLIIISAFSLATRSLKKAALLAEEGKIEKAVNILNSVLDEHNNYANELLQNAEIIENLKKVYSDGCKRIYDYLKGISITRELLPLTLDSILSYGEYFALHTVNYYLIEQGFAINCIDSTEIIVSDDSYGSAKPLIKETKEKVQEILIPVLNNKNIVITQGFVAKNLSGKITTMGIESSNLTATLLALLLDVDELTFWTDVEGIRSADPKFIENSKPIPELSYHFAYKAAVNGLKLIYPSMIDFAEEKKLKLIYRSAFNPKGDFSVICSPERINNIPLIVSKDNLTLIQLDFISDKERLEFNRFIIDNELILKSSFTYNIAKDSAYLLVQDKLGTITELLKDFPFNVVNNCSMITVFGISQDSASTLFEELNRKMTELNLIELDINTSTHTLRIILSDEKSIDAIKYLHDSLLK